MRECVHSVLPVQGIGLCLGRSRSEPVQVHMDPDAVSGDDQQSESGCREGCKQDDEDNLYFDGKYGVGFRQLNNLFSRDGFGCPYYFAMKWRDLR